MSKSSQRRIFEEYEDRLNELLEDVDSEVEIEDEDREDLQKELKKMNDDIADWLIDMEEDRWNEERHLISKAREVLDLIQDVSDEYRLDIDPVPNPEREQEFYDSMFPNREDDDEEDSVFGDD